METNWFKKVGWFYLPCSIIGVVILIVFGGNALLFLKVIDHHSHSVSDTFINFFPYAAAFFVFYEWIAKNTSSEE